jgi:hypothetical protein
MAKRGSKAAAVREYIQEHPTAKTREIVDALAKQRIKVSESQVYAILGKSNGEVAAPKAPTTNGQPAAEQPLLTTKAFVIAAGGIDKARASIDELASLQLT